MNHKLAFLSGYRLPRLEEVLFLALFIGVVVNGPRLLNADGDLGRHLTIGTYILQNLIIPTRDIFSNTMLGQPLTPHEWLSQVIFALIYRLAGLNGVVLLCALLIATTFTLVYRQVLQRSGMALLSMILAVFAAVTASIHWLARPHLWTMLMVVLWVGELERLRHGDRRGWWRLPLLMILWVNLHGAFIAGFAIWLIYGAGWLWERWTEDKTVDLSNFPGIVRQFLTAGVVSFFASFINPSTWYVWSTSLGYIRNRYLVGHTAEYLPPDFHQVWAWPFLGLIVLSLLFLGLRRNRLHSGSIFLLAAWSAMGLYSSRNIPIYAIIAVPILGEIAKSGLTQQVVAFEEGGFHKFIRVFLTRIEHLEKTLQAVDSSMRAGLWSATTILLISSLLIGGTRLDLSRRGNFFDPRVFPVDAVNWMQANPLSGNGFNYFTWGGYLLYRLWPGERVFIDGQTDFYGESLTRQYEKVITVEDGWQEILHQYQVTWILMPGDSLLTRTLRNDSSWKVVYQDQTAVLFSNAQ